MASRRATGTPVRWGWGDTYIGEKAVQKLGLLVICLVVLLGGGGGGAPRSWCADGVSPDSSSSYSSPARLSHLSILLPLTLEGTPSFILRAYSGCFEFRAVPANSLKLKGITDNYNSTETCLTAAEIVPSSSLMAEERADERGTNAASRIIAKDIGTARELSCQVFVNTIKKLQINHHTLKVNVGELTALYMEGFDAVENTFSTLEGLKFAWSIRKLNSARDHIGGGEREGEVWPLLNVPIRETTYGTSAVRIGLEAKGYGSDVHVVRGEAVGQAEVTGLLHHDFSDKSTGADADDDRLTASIKLTIVEEARIVPSIPLIRMLPLSTMPLLLRFPREGAPDDSRFYSWGSFKQNTLHVDFNSGLITAERPGSPAVVYAEDMRLPAGEQREFAEVHVVEAQSLQLVVIPQNERDSLLTVKTWEAEGLKVPSRSTDDIFVVEGRNYIVLPLTRDLGGHTILLTNSTAIDIRFDASNALMWEKKETADIAAESARAGFAGAVEVEMKEEGQGKVFTTLEWYVEDPDSPSEWLRKHVSNGATLHVCKPIQLSIPSPCGNMRPGSKCFEREKVNELHLPMRVKTLPQQEYQLRPSGGCRWGDPSLRFQFGVQGVEGLVTAGGRLASSGHDLPLKERTFVATIASAHDLKEGHNLMHLPVSLSAPSVAAAGGMYSMGILEQNAVIEVVEGSSTFLYFVLLDAENRAYSSCNAFNDETAWMSPTGDKINLKKSTLKEMGTMPSGACSAARVDLGNSQSAVVEASVTVPSGNSPQGVQLKATWNLRKFPKLSLHLPHLDVVHSVLISVGSTLNVTVKGGPVRGAMSRWELFEIKSADGKSGIEGLIAGEIPGNDGKMLLSLACSDVGNFFLAVGVLAIPGDKRTLITSASIRVRCEIPESLAPVFDDLPQKQFQMYHESNGLLPNALSGNGQSLVNQVPYVGRVVAMAQDGTHFDSVNAFHFIWRSSQEVLGFSKADEENFSIVSVKLAKTEGQTNIDLEAASFAPKVEVNEASIGAIQAKIPLLKASLPVKVVHPLSLLKEGQEAEAKDAGILLYPHRSAQRLLKVKGGTSSLAVDSQKSLVSVIAVDVRRSDGLKTVMLLPLAKGVDHLTFYDKESGQVLHQRAKIGAVSSVRVGGNSRAKEQMLPLGHTLNITCKAYDDEGQQFAAEQSSYMEPKVESSGNSLKISSDGAGNATLLGVKHGDAMVHATLIRDGMPGESGQERVSSNVLEISVHEPLRVDPSDLVLGVGVSFVLGTRGGPKLAGAEVRYISSNTTVASVHEHAGCLQTFALGKTDVTAELVLDGTVVASAKSAINVMEISSVRIALQGRLEVGRSTSALVTGTAKSVDLFSFAQLCSAYEWSSENPDILAIEQRHSHFIAESMIPQGGRPEHSSSECGVRLADSGFSVRVRALQAGVGTINVKMVCKNVIDGTTTRLHAATSVVTIPNPPQALDESSIWMMPPNFGTASNLLSSGNFARGNFTVHAVDKAQAQSLLRIREDGGIQSGSDIGIACIQQHVDVLVACVRVSRASTILIGGEQILKSSHDLHLVDISVGAAASHPVGILNEIGLPFLYPSLSFEADVTVNRRDIVSVSVSNSTSTLDEDSEFKTSALSLTISGLREGVALVRLRIFADVLSQPIVAFIAVRVGEHIVPQSPRMLVGEKLQFTLQSPSASDSRRIEDEDAVDLGKWSSSDPTVVDVDSSSGIAVGTGSGTTRVYFNSTFMTTYTHVEVVRLAAATVKHPENVRVITNLQNGGPAMYQFPVEFYDQAHHHISSSVGQDIKFECMLQPESIGQALPHRDLNTGETSCLLKMTLPNNELPAEIDASLSMKFLSPRAHTSRDDSQALQWHTANTLQVHYVGSFQLASGIPRSIQLTPEMDRISIQLQGNMATVTANNMAGEAIDAYRDPRVPGVFTIRAKQNRHNFHAQINFVSDVTDQVLEMPITFQVSGVSTATYNAVFAITGTILAAVVAIVFLLTRNSGASTNAGHFVSPPANVKSNGLHQTLDTPETPAGTLRQAMSPSQVAEGGSPAVFRHRPVSAFKAYKSPTST